MIHSVDVKMILMEKFIYNYWCILFISACLPFVISLWFLVMPLCAVIQIVHSWVALLRWWYGVYHLFWVFIMRGGGWEVVMPGKAGEQCLRYRCLWCWVLPGEFQRKKDIHSFLMEWRPVIWYEYDMMEVYSRYVKVMIWSMKCAGEIL